MMGAFKKQQAYRRGVQAESRAADYLRLKGYSILETRYKTPVGEVDLVALKGDTLVFVEVKARRTKEEGLEAVQFRARRRIEQAALHYMAAHENYSDFGMRFDVIVAVSEKAVLKVLGAISFHHLDNAWQAGQ